VEFHARRSQCVMSIFFVTLPMPPMPRVQS